MSTLADRPVVLDASVVVKLVLVEELTSTAWRLYEDAFARDRYVRGARAPRERGH